MAFIVYNASTRVVHSANISQAAANAVVTKRTADRVVDTDLPVLTAHTGNVTIPRTFEPGRMFFDAVSAAVSFDYRPTASDLELTKEALRAGHDQFFNSWYPGLIAEAAGHEDDSRILGVNLLLGGWKSVYITAINTAVSLPLRRSMVEQMSQGASDVVNAFTFYQKAEALTIPSTFTAAHPVSWVVVSGSAFIRRTLQASINAAATDFPRPPSFSAIQLTSPSWIENIT